MGRTERGGGMRNEDTVWEPLDKEVRMAENGKNKTKTSSTWRESKQNCLEKSRVSGGSE